jgi:hypothetical protein
MRIGRREWRDFAQRLRPVNAGWELKRVGGSGDGSYLVPDDFEDLAGHISPGVSDLVNFELQLADDYGISSALFDASIEKLPVEHKKLTFHKKFIGSPLRKDYITLNETLENFPSSTRASLMLQMDIEGDELLALNQLKMEELDNFRILVIEFHRVQDWTNKTVFNHFVKPLFENIGELFDIVHLHPNNCDGEFYFAGFFFPRAVEITFHHKSRRRKDLTSAFVPHPLDYPNTLEVPDIKLKF